MGHLLYLIFRFDRRCDGKFGKFGNFVGTKHTHSVLWLACGNFVLALWASRQVQFCHRPVGRHSALGGRQASCRVGSHEWKMKREKFVLVEVFNLNEQLVKRSFRIGIPLHQKKSNSVKTIEISVDSSRKIRDKNWKINCAGSKWALREPDVRQPRTVVLRPCSIQWEGTWNVKPFMHA